MACARPNKQSNIIFFQKEMKLLFRSVLPIFKQSKPIWAHVERTCCLARKGQYNIGCFRCSVRPCRRWKYSFTGWGPPLRGKRSSVCWRSFWNGNKQLVAKKESIRKVLLFQGTLRLGSLICSRLANIKQHIELQAANLIPSRQVGDLAFLKWEGSWRIHVLTNRIKGHPLWFYDPMISCNESGHSGVSSEPLCYTVAAGQNFVDPIVKGKPQTKTAAPADVCFWLMTRMITMCFTQKKVRLFTDHGSFVAPRATCQITKSARNLHTCWRRT